MSVVKHPGTGEAFDRPLLEPADVCSTVMRGRLGRPTVVLQVDLDPLPVAAQDLEELVVLRDREPVAVDQHPHDRALGHLVEQLGQSRVEGRLAAAEHLSTSIPALFSCESRASIEASTSSSGTTEARAGAEAAKHVGHLRLQWSRRSSSRMQVCWVCISGSPSRIRRRHGSEVAGHVGGVNLGRGGPLLEVGHLGRLVVQRAVQPCQPSRASARSGPRARPATRTAAGRPRVAGPAPPRGTAGRTRSRSDGSGRRATACRPRRPSVRPWSSSLVHLLLGPPPSVARDCRPLSPRWIMRSTTSGMAGARNSWARVSPCQTTSLPRTNSTRNRNTPYDATYQTNTSPGGAGLMAQPGPDQQRRQRGGRRSRRGTRHPSLFFFFFFFFFYFL